VMAEIVVVSHLMHEWVSYMMDAGMSEAQRTPQHTGQRYKHNGPPSSSPSSQLTRRHHLCPSHSLPNVFSVFSSVRQALCMRRLAKLASDISVGGGRTPPPPPPKLVLPPAPLPMLLFPPPGQEVDDRSSKELRQGRCWRLVPWAEGVKEGEEGEGRGWGQRHAAA
jgi:hypothetical protein